MQTAKPYIGVSAITTVEEMEAVIRSFLSHGITPDASHVPMVGLLVSHEEAKDRPLRATRYVDASAVPALIACAAGRVSVSIHYESAHPSSLADDIRRVMESCGAHLPTALQLNVECFSELTAALKKIHEEFPSIHLILQLRPTLLESGTENIVDAVKSCGEYLQYVLIDASCGTGKPMDATFAAELYEAFHRRIPHIMVGCAGGLSPENLEAMLSSLIERISSRAFCIDAESRLRTKDDALDVDRTDLFIARAAALLF